MGFYRQIRYMIVAGVMFAATSSFAQSTQQATKDDPFNPPNIEPSLAGMGSGTDQGNIGPFVTVTDKQFAQNMETRSMMEIELGNVALEKSTNEKTKQLAHDMIDTHTKWAGSLNRVAVRLGIRLPQELDAKHKATIEKIKAMSGAQFDQAYFKEVESLQNKAVAVTHNEATNGGVAGLRNWAGTMVPVLQEQVRLAKQGSGNDAVTSKR